MARRPYSMEGARAQGAQDYETQRLNLTGFLDDAFNKSTGYYKSRGFGGGLESPGTLESIRSPYIAQEGKRLTDLWFGAQDRAQSNALRWNADRRSNIMADQQYEMSEDALSANRRKGSSGTVLCTALYRQGLLPLKYIKADLTYLKNYVSKQDHKMYLAWANPIAEAMLKSKVLTYLLYLPLMAWNIYMYRVVKLKPLGVIGFIGKTINEVGLHFGRRIYVGRVA